MGRYSSVYEAICARIANHTAIDGLLAGVKFEPNPVREITGTKDLPAGRMMPPDLDEIARPVALADGTFKMVLDVHTQRGVADEVINHLRMVEKFMDAVNMDGSTLDLLLGGRLQKAPVMTCRDMVAKSDVSISSQLTLILTPKTCIAGGRHV